MSLIDPAPPRWTETLLSVLRIVAAFLLFWHGTQKMFAYPPAVGATGPAQAFHLVTQQGLAAVLEIGGGFLLVLGLFTRPVAFVLSGEMAVAYFQVHYPRAFLPIVNRGELAALLCFVFLYLAFAGGGDWSLDALLRERRRAKIGG